VEIKEVCPLGIEIIGSIANRICRDGGAALIIDYGSIKSGHGDTLQALSEHRYADILETLGEADLTAHVDFESLGNAAQQAGAKVHGPIFQGAFLQRLGVEIRAAQLLDSANEKQAFSIRSGIKRLIDPQEMGTLFKVMVITAPGGALPPGFEGD
jgi:SAM-dependent MidA family methyltransferase